MKKGIGIVLFRVFVLSLVFAVALAGVGYVYLSGQQEWTSKVILSFDNPDAVRGFALDGTKTEEVIGELKSATVIAKAAEAIGNEEVSPNQIASSLDVEEVIPELETERKNSAMKNGLDYEYYPVTYQITYTIDEGRNVQKELAKIMDAYLANYEEKHINEEAIPANSMLVSDASLEPFKEVEQICTHVDEMVYFLTAQAEKYPHYRAVGSGLSYRDLLKTYRYIRDWEVAELMSAILEGQISVNPESLVLQFQKTIQLNQETAVNVRADMDDAVKLMESYSEKNKVWGSWTQFESDKYNEIDLNHDEILDELYPNSSHPRTAYDTIMDKYIKEGDGLGLNNQQNIYLEYLISVFDGAEPSSEETLKAFRFRIASLKEELVELYEDAFETEEEHISVLSSESLSVKTTPNKTQKYRVKLYTAVLFAGGFVMSAIVLLWVRSIYITLHGKKEGESEEGGEKPQQST